jgi:hypothetical protein
MCSLDGLHCRRNLGVRSGKQSSDLIGQRLVGREAGELALPEVEIAPGQPVEIGMRTGASVGGRFIVVSGHATTIAHRPANAAFAVANPTCRTAVSALM